MNCSEDNYYLLVLSRLMWRLIWV